MKSHLKEILEKMPFLFGLTKRKFVTIFNLLIILPIKKGRL